MEWCRGQDLNLRTVEDWDLIPAPLTKLGNLCVSRLLCISISIKCSSKKSSSRSKNHLHFLIRIHRVQSRSILRLPITILPLDGQLVLGHHLMGIQWYCIHRLLPQAPREPLRLLEEVQRHLLASDLLMSKLDYRKVWKIRWSNAKHDLEC